MDKESLQRGKATLRDEFFVMGVTLSTGYVLMERQSFRVEDEQHAEAVHQ